MSSCLAPRVLWTQLILLNTYQMSTLVEELIMKGMKVKVTQSCLTLCDPMDYTVHEILQAKILEWVAFPFSRGSSWPRNQTRVSCIVGGFFTSWATREAQGANCNNAIVISNKFLLIDRQQTFIEKFQFLMLHISSNHSIKGLRI